MKLAAVVKSQSRPKEEAEERLRDPPPPANFPPVCPKNPKLRHIIANVDRNVFQRIGLHNIPYRDSSEKHLPIQVFDGERWPDTEVKTDMPTINIGSEDVIDVWTQRSKQKEVEQASRVVYHDIPHNALMKLIAAIRHPVEVRLLPHIIREWHRQNFPISVTDSQRIASVATKYNQVEVILQMVQPDVFGLYYDMKGVREITRGMAKKAAVAGHTEGQKEFIPESMLKWAPELLKCSVGADAKRILRDPPVLGTQLFGFVARFNSDKQFRTSKSVTEMCGLVERIIETLVENDFGPAVSSAESLSAGDRRQLAFDIKYEVIDYIPLVQALRQFTEIIYAPYRASLSALERPDTARDREATQLSGEVRHFLHTRMSIPSVSEKTAIDTEVVAANELKWTQLNRKLGAHIKSKKIDLSARSPWERGILKQYTTPAIGRSNSAVPASEYGAYYLPLRLQWAAGRMQQRLGEWQKLLKLEEIPAKSSLNIDIIKYGEIL